MQLRACGHSLDGGDRASDELDRQQQAAQLGPSIDQHRASATFAELASMLGAGQLHVLAQDLEQRLMNGQQELGALAVDVERHDLALHVAKHLLLHLWWSIAFNAEAHSHRSGTTAWARLEAGFGSSGYTRMVCIPKASAGSMSFSSRLPMKTQRSGGEPATLNAISNTARGGFRGPAADAATDA